VKTYRCANLLAIFVTLIAGFASVADQTKAFFVVPATTETVNQPAEASNFNFNLTKIETLEQGTIPAIINNPKITARTTTPAPVTPTVRPPVPIAICGGYYGYITIGGKNICLASTNTTAGSLSYNHAYIYNTELSSNKYIFGHNSAALFGNLSSLNNGTTFSVTIAGKTTNYRISFKEVTCDYTNPSYPCSNYPEPVLNMNDVIMPHRRGADLAIMTCAGTPIGNGDATHRLTVYANKI